jgi:hypothetical protein
MVYNIRKNYLGIEALDTGVNGKNIKVVVTPIIKT